MGNIQTDDCLTKLRWAADSRLCVICGRLPFAEHSDLYGHGYLDPSAEPIFVLRAQDTTAHLVVRYWLALNSGCPPEKYADAERTINAMAEWPGRRAAD